MKNKIYEFYLMLLFTLLIGCASEKTQKSNNINSEGELGTVTCDDNHAAVENTALPVVVVPSVMSSAKPTDENIDISALRAEVKIMNEYLITVNKNLSALQGLMEKSDQMTKDKFDLVFGDLKVMENINGKIDKLSNDIKVINDREEDLSRRVGEWKYYTK